MAIKQMIWSLDDRCALASSALLSENELEDLIAENIELLNDNWMVAGRQVRTEYGGSIDLLCVDIGLNLIVVELKKDMTPREVIAQALDYASWAESIDADRLAEIYLKYANNRTPLDEAYKSHFGVELAGDDRNAEEADVKIVIVATALDSSTERIIQYLRDRGEIEIDVLFFNVFEHHGNRYLSRAWLHQMDDMTVKPKTSSRNWNGEFYTSFGESDNRSWEDAANYGFVSAGGGSWYTDTLKHLNPGDRIWVNIPRSGYVGVGVVKSSAVVANEAVVNWDGKDTLLHELPLQGKYDANTPGSEEYVVGVEWLKTVPKSKAVSEYGFFGNQNTVCKPKDEKWTFTVQRLRDLWGIE